MNLFAITIKGVHDLVTQRRYYGVASDMPEAMSLALRMAVEEGWRDPFVDDATNMGQMAFGPDAPQQGGAPCQQ